MSVQTFARIFGIVFLLVGIAGFVPGLTVPHTHPDVTVTSGLGLVFGLFPVNILHNLTHILFGIWGLVAARSIGGSRGYARAVAIAYALLAVMGLIAAARLYTTFGLIPLYGHDVWLHVLLAAGGAYFGFMHRDAGVTTAARV